MLLKKKQKKKQRNNAYDLFYWIELMLNNFGGNFGIFGCNEAKNNKWSKKYWIERKKQLIYTW